MIAKPFDVDKVIWHVRDLLAMPHRAPVPAYSGDLSTALGSVVSDLVDVMILANAEQLADVPTLLSEARPLAARGLDLTHHAAALVRRLNHLSSAPE